MSFAERLVKQRKENNMSQEQLADKLGISRQAISKWESGEVIPDMAKILKLCKILNCNLEDLMDVGVNKSERCKEKYNMTDYFKEFLDFITKTVNMFWSMTFGEKIRCICEMLFVIFILFILWYIIGAIVNSIFFNNFNLEVNKFYYFFRGLCSLIYGLFGFILGFVIVIHIFKVRYLDYFVTITDPNCDKKTKEEAICNDNDNKEIRFINNKKNKIIIRDPVHSSSKFFDMLGNVLICIFKFCLLCFVIPFIFSFIFFIVVLLFSLINSLDSLFFRGISIAIIGVILINYLVLKIVYKIVLNLKFNFSLLFILIITGLILIGVGSGISFCCYFNFDTVKDENVDYTITDFEIDYEDNLVLSFIDHENIEIVEDNNVKNIKIEFRNRNDVEVNLYSNLDYYYADNNIIYKVYDYDVLNKYSDNFIDSANMFIDDIKDKKIRVYDYNNISDIKIISNKDIIDKLKDNYRKRL